MARIALADGTAVPKLLNVAMMLLEFEKERPKPLVTKEEWLSQKSQEGFNISQELLNKSMQLAELQDSDLFVTPLDRVMRLLDEVRLLSVRVAKLETHIMNAPE